MSETTRIDRKGRLVLPKAVREGAHIGSGSRLVARVKGEGQVELFDPEKLMKRAQEIGSKKLRDWKEVDHLATRALMKVAKSQCDSK